MIEKKIRDAANALRRNLSDFDPGNDSIIEFMDELEDAIDDAEKQLLQAVNDPIAPEPAGEGKRWRYDAGVPVLDSVSVTGEVVARNRKYATQRANFEARKKLEAMASESEMDFDWSGYSGAHVVEITDE
jgi:hypothetical protein